MAALIRLINPFLQDIKDKGGFYDFAVQCDEETNTPAVIDRNELVARIFVKPRRRLNSSNSISCSPPPGPTSKKSSRQRKEVAHA